MGKLAALINLLSASSRGRWPLFANRAKRKMSLFRIQLSILITWPEMDVGMCGALSQNAMPFFGFKHVWFLRKRACDFETAICFFFVTVPSNICPNPYQLQWCSSISDAEIKPTGCPHEKEGVFHGSSRSEGTSQQPPWCSPMKAEDLTTSRAPPSIRAFLPSQSKTVTWPYLLKYKKWSCFQLNQQLSQERDRVLISNQGTQMANDRG